MKVSHKEESVLEGFLGNLRSEFRQEDELTENTGIVHDYAGIKIDYSIAGKVVFTMFDCLEHVIVEAAKDLKNSCSYYPGNDQLMKVNYDSPSLSTKIILLKHFKEKHSTLIVKPSWGWMRSTSLCFTRSIKIRTGEIVSISPPIHNK